MKQFKFLFIAAIALPLLAATARADIATAGQPDPNPSAKKLCETVSLVTGVAISPLMGVSGVGAYEYFSAKSAEEKAKLPWFANPLFWLPAMLLVGVCFLKDSAGATVLPTVLKKPLDAAETIEHKVSGLVATAGRRVYFPRRCAARAAKRARHGGVCHAGFALALQCADGSGRDGRVLHRVPRVERHQYFDPHQPVHDD